MPRNNYCDFCQCTFPDNKTNRNNHNQGTTHINNRKLHYDWYKDPLLFLQEQTNKPPCRHYQNHGYCEFGLSCKYSHIILDPTTGPIYPPELIQWLQPKESPKPLLTRYKLPSGWKVKDLPPSLKPPPSKHGYNWDIVGSWSL